MCVCVTPAQECTRRHASEEAHGGYSYCGLATLCIAGKADALDLHGPWDMNFKGSNMQIKFKEMENLDGNSDDLVDTAVPPFKV